MLLRAAKNNGRQNYSNLHDDFDNSIDYIVSQAGNVNVYDIKIDGEYEGKNQINFRIFAALFQRSSQHKTLWIQHWNSL